MNTQKLVPLVLEIARKQYKRDVSAPSQAQKLLRRTTIPALNNIGLTIESELYIEAYAAIKKKFEEAEERSSAEEESLGLYAKCKAKVFAQVHGKKDQEKKTTALKQYSA